MMIFSPELIELIKKRKKTVTRRRAPARYQVGKVYAVQPGRGKRHVGHIEVTSVNIESLQAITEEEARLEGFTSTTDFIGYWLHLHGTWNPSEEVVRIAFKLAPSCVVCDGGSDE